MVVHLINVQVIASKSSPITNCMSCLVKFGDMHTISKMSVFPVLSSRCVCSSLFK